MESDFNPLSSSYLYLKDNIKDQKTKNMLYDIYKKYGPMYVLSAVSEKGEIIEPETPIIDIDYENYRVPNLLEIRDYSSIPGMLLQSAFYELGLTHWTSLRYDLHLAGNSEAEFVFAYGSEYVMRWDKNGFFYDDFSGDEGITYFGGALTPIITTHTVQINLGFTSDSKFKFELWFDREKQASYDMNLMFNNSVSNLRFGTFSIKLYGDTDNVATISFEEPIVQCVSNSFLSLFETNL